jgi:predicted enzyme related to lactoylglutathione lyase
MLGTYNIWPDIAVKDLAKAKKFYQDTLGLKLLDENKEAMTLLFQSGNGKVNVYQSQYAGTNQATYMTWQVDDIEGTVAALKGKGMGFEHYDLPGVTMQGDVHVWGEMKAAWFKDPEGNILCLANMG